MGPVVFVGRDPPTIYTHPLNWEESIKMKLFQIENVDDQSCICKACEKDVKWHITAGNYHPQWRPKQGILDRCIVPTYFHLSGLVGRRRPVWSR